MYRAELPLGGDGVGHGVDGHIDRDPFAVAVGPHRELDLAVGQRPGPDREPVGDADQLGVGELDAGSGVAIVEQHVDPAGLQAPVQFLGCGHVGSSSFRTVTTAS